MPCNSSSKFAGPKKGRVGEKNPMFGRKHSKETLEKMRQVKLDDKNPNWAGKDAGYYAIHYWVKARLTKPDNCQRCNEKKSLDLANISQEYQRDITDWEWLCRKCHMVGDGRYEKFINCNKREGTTK